MNEPAPLPPDGLSPDLDRMLATLPPDEAARLREVWALAALAAPADDLDAEAAARTERHLATLASGAEAPRTTPARRPDRAALAGRRTPLWRGVLASAFVVFAVVVGLLWMRQPVVVEASVGERVAVRLPDGSAVTLNSGSTLRRARTFGSGDVRMVMLEGEAFFDVAEGEVPFVVRTFDAEVTVLGTRFGVRAWPGEGEMTTVALVSGSVRLASGGAAVVLQPGEVGHAADGALLAGAEAGGVEAALAWRGGDLVFKDRPLDVILNDVARRFGIEVAVQPASLGRRRVSVALRDPTSAGAVVRDLATALGLRYRARAGGFELYAAAVTL
jgi:ferric-dicitrate binding protein FerR (iron transport regulator)